MLLFAFALFSLTASEHLQGYEAETMAASEGFARTGDFQLLTDSPFTGHHGHRGEGGRLYGRTTVVEPLLAAPLIWVGYRLDRASGGVRFRAFFARYFNPFMAALAAAGIFLLLVRYRSPPTALAVAMLFAVASIAWPYARIGMETTFMALLVLTLLAADWARRAPTIKAWAVTGVIGGAAMVGKPYAVLAVAPLALLLIPALRRPPRQAIALAAAVVIPVVGWAAVTLWYNAARHGSMLDFGSAERLSPTVAGPFNWLGLLASPGKGLLLYSPLVVLGLLGVRTMWRADRTLTAASLSSFGLLSAFIAISSHWSEETWGPRYIVPVAWLLLLPIAWWATTPDRWRAIKAVAVGAVVVQLLAVLIPYHGYFRIAPALSGVSLFQQRGSSAGGTDIRDSVPSVPYGRDPMRWVPQMSPLLLQAELVTSIASEKAGGSALTITYAPFEGRRTVTDLAGAQGRLELPFPDFAWAGGNTIDAAWGAVMLLVLAGSSLALTGPSDGLRRWLPRAGQAAG